MGTAAVQGALWGARAKDWAEVQEPAWQPVYRTALAHAGLRRGMALLDIGCGAGGALVLAREMGAEVAGLDASANLVEVARERLPGARVELGEMEGLPFGDTSFDLVTGFNSFQFAGNLVKALSEACRVCRPDGSVFMLTWGRREDCELMKAMSPVTALLPPPPSDVRPPSPLLERDELDDSMRQARLEPSRNGDFAAELRFADLQTAVRAIMAAGVTVRAVQVVGEERVSATVRQAMSAFIRPDGSVSFSNRFNWMRAARRSA